MNRVIAFQAILLLAGAAAAPALAANKDIENIDPGDAANVLCEEATAAKTDKDLDGIFDFGQALYQPRLRKYQDARRAHFLAEDVVESTMDDIRQSVLKKRGIDDKSIEELEQDVKRWSRNAEEYDGLEKWQRTNIVEDPREVLHDRIVALEAARKTRKTVDTMSDEAIRAFGTGIMRDRYEHVVKKRGEAKTTLDELEPKFLPWKETVSKVYDCIEARRAALKKEPQGFAAASAKGSINGKCSGNMALFGGNKRSSWPLNGSITLTRDTEGKVQFSLVTKDRGQKLTLHGDYGPNFTASGGAGTIHMNVKGSLSELPDRPDRLKGSGTGKSADNSQLKINCNFSWRTNP